MKSNKYKINSGFTLVELLVTVAIVGIFASIALPSFSKMIEKNRVNTATNELVSNLLLARSEALKRSNNVTLCPSDNQTSCASNGDYSKGWIVFLDCDDDLVLGETITDCGPNGTEDIIKVHDGFDSVYMNKNGGVKKVSFSFSGRLAIPASTFSVGKDVSNKTKRVSLNRVGRIRTDAHP